MPITNSCGKVVIIGSGFVGSTGAFTIAMSDVASSVVLIDINTEKAKGEALDISHSLPLMGSVKVSSGGFEEVRDAHVIVIAAGANRKPGETRLDLLKKNDSIIREITKRIMAFYNGGVVLVISNPVDVLTYIVQKQSGLPPSKVFGSGTMLDTLRYRCSISEYYNVKASDVVGFMIGEHGESVVPVWSLASIKGIPLDEFDRFSGKKIAKTEIEEEIRAAGARVIKFKGATYFAIATIIGQLVKTIIKNECSVFPVSSFLDGSFGIKDVALSLPSIINSDGIQSVMEIGLSAEERQKLLASAGKLKEVLSNLQRV
jgi:L-lactate dehydrogenase